MLDKALNMFSGLVRKPERVENTTIKMELDYEATKKHREAVELLIPNFQGAVKPGDTLRISYDFLIEYFGNVNANLQAIRELCEDPNIVVAASCNRLQKGSCVLFDTLKAFENIIEQIKAREE